LAGVVDGARRKVEGDKRHRILQIREGLLATPPGETPVSHPAILNLQICVEDLRREVADMLDPPRYGSNAMKRRAIAEQIKRYGLQKLDDMGPDEAALTIANRVKTAYDGLIVSSAAIRAQITAHKERAASGIG
jgi:hypothetical protein